MRGMYMVFWVLLPALGCAAREDAEDHGSSISAVGHVKSDEAHRGQDERWATNETRAPVVTPSFCSREE